MASKHPALLYESRPKGAAVALSSKYIVLQLHNNPVKRYIEPITGGLSSFFSHFLKVFFFPFPSIFLAEILPDLGYVQEKYRSTLCFGLN